MGLLDNLLSTGAQVAGIESSRNALLDAGSAAQTGAAQVGGTAAGMAQFQPFAVTGGTGSLTTDAQGGFGMQLNPQQQALQNNMFGAAQGLSGQIGQQANPMYGQMANQAYGQSQNALGQVGQYDQQMLAQRNAFGGMFGQQLGQYGQPSGLEGLTQQALGQGQQQLSQAQQPLDINLLRGQYANQVSGLLGQQPSNQFNNLAQYSSAAGLSGLQGAGGAGAGLNQLGLNFANQAQGMLGQSTASQQMQNIGQQAYGGAGQQLTRGAPQDIEALRSQYAGMAGQAATDLGSMNQVGRQQDIYNQLRSMQTPEEERQRLALEERLQAQGRGGIQTAQYGGTPEQLAMAKAQAEAQNQAGMMAMQQAGSEQDRAYQQALGLAGQTSQFAGTSSDLQSASQQRGAQLAQLGMSTEQIQSQLATEGLGRTTATAGMGSDLQGQSEALKGQAQQRAAQLSQMGMSAEQIQSQLQSEGLSRGIQAGTAAGQLAGVASNLESAGIDRGNALSQLGMAGAQQTQSMGAEQLRQLMALQQQDIGSAASQQALQQGNLGLAGGLFDYGTASAMQPGQMTQQQLQTLTGMMGAGYAPENQLLNMLAGGTNVASIADLGRRSAADQYAEANMSGLEGMLQSRQGAADLNQRYYEALSGLANSQNSQGQGMVSQIWDGQGGAGSGGGLGGFLSGLLGGNPSMITQDTFGSGLSDYLGGATQGGSTGNFMNDLFNGYTPTTTSDGGTFFGSGSGTGYDFGTSFDPNAISMFTGGSNVFDGTAGGGSFDAYGNYIPGS